MNYLLRDVEGLTLTTSQKSAIRNSNPNLQPLTCAKPSPTSIQSPLGELGCFIHCEASLEEVEEHCQSCIEGKK